MKLLGIRLMSRELQCIQELGKISPDVCGAVQSRLCREETFQWTAYRSME